jgi:HSP20 family molecular chaperone IbpA
MLKTGTKPARRIDMSQVAVEKVKETGTAGTGILDEIQDLGQRIRERAFELFTHRGSADGRDLEDWLRAERDVLFSPQSELVEKNGTFTVRLNTHGFKADEVKVTALPHELVVKAECRNEREKKDAEVHFSEFSQKMLFRRYPLPEPIAVDKVTATLDNGILQLTAPKEKSDPVTKTTAAA